MSKIKIYVKTILVFFPLISLSQDNLESMIELHEEKGDKVTATFKSGQLINIQSTETIHKKELNFRVDHRFGDIAGKAGGVKQFFGLDQSTDIRIGFDYGILDNLNIGIARAKGATEITQLYEGNFKYRFLTQSVNNQTPVSIALFSSATITGAEKSNTPSATTSYRNFSDRITYVSQLIIARKFNSSFSFEIIPTYVHQNYTAFGDQNATFAVAFGGRMKLNKRIAVVADYVAPFRNKEKKEFIENISGNKFYNALGVGLEMDTGGHIFHLNFTNAKALQESQYITETNSTWTKGQFRWGFSISRRFSFDKKENQQ